ncbi:bifunctional 4-hydroxy-2-oxoglutarate aldolase/2-dehydro-3-deoxy-phosphogluconate aldolase [Paenactinomyces guangxiensis]|uniref:Bifunctional 4-hydroxy-2-oxoglutarate aldolase/2-dehydro-3-deoxy-phosphogluconate aldolase n=1 Tax=Paenactinomyces guangxiensis TaxID=1490290 RepID=A0A7W1WNH6_9BACL|nr:bifunctional 4-hydroxy-2-oxoglutarate aldolase/2-dehydro-3-deoxy-phosphogluconate aldolase [Paenactinomyces guangxiensis]MBA4493061.1 bifunctional 4-hydroxy-2-oxoglutarate aldolase/2-dehydro-3-deoxy-phosphogluconate aldolase [Paenactinomyces guangxiensis]MBH8590090.1 bifunctional 4-hydroxy-2-oxoglutarate aldolase/2-dehydro-3-deoxy-phosphogluconate aldolase [Paenactinomyces guangxiensis]
MNLLNQIKENGIVAVIRGARPQNVSDIARALKNGGVKTLEITVETPKVLSLIEQVSDEFGDEVIVGAGTVLDPETARAAIMAGAKFIFSPTVNPETIKMAKRYGVLSIPGALTPTEILTAYENGADLIKVFPANLFGPRYIKDIHGPMPHIPLMPTGGLNVDNVGDYIKAGAVAAGIGSSLVNTKKAMNEDYFIDLENKASQFVQAVNAARV